MAERPRLRPGRTRTVLDLPRVMAGTDGQIDPEVFEQYTKVLQEWARNREDRYGDDLWVPQLTAVTTAPTLGSGATASGDWHYEDGWVTLRFLVIFGTAGTNAGSGIYELINLPFRIDFHGETGVAPVGQVNLRDAGVANKWWTVIGLNATTLRFVDPNSVDTAHNVPWAWGANDSMRGWARYKVAPSNTRKGGG